MTALRLVFMGTPEFALPCLRALNEAGHEIAAVYCQPPRPAGRGHRPRPAPVQAEAERRGLPLRTPVRLREPAVQAGFAALEPDAAVVVAYGLILPRPILEAPRLGCLNLHASLLPRWRGAAPIQRAILAGDEETGVTIMQLDEGLDTGPILLQERVPITKDTDAGELHDRLAGLGAKLIVEALAALEEGRLEPRPQPQRGATYARKLAREEARIDWSRPAIEIARLVRALAPRPGAATELPDGGQLKVLAAEPAPGRSGAEPGTVLDGALTVACGLGGLKATRVQRRGKAPMDAEAFLRGYRLEPGAVLR